MSDRLRYIKLSLVCALALLIGGSCVWWYMDRPMGVERFDTLTRHMVQATTTSRTAPTDPEPAAGTSHAPVSVTAGMHLTFDEEFDTFSRYVDHNGNITCHPDGSGIWQTVYDFCSRTNPGNDEAEVYTDPGFYAYLKHEPATTSLRDPELPFSLSQGVLAITARPASTQVTSAVGAWAKYTSGLITTQFSFSQKYGYFEMRAKLPKGKGLWPAFWLLPDDQSWPPEIDAMEAFGAPNAKGEGGVTAIHYASHALKPGESCGGWHGVGTDITDSFHTYGVDIEPTHITYYFDSLPYATCSANSAANQKFYLLIDLAVGGATSWPGMPDQTTPFPATLAVDYVRAYQHDTVVQ